MTGVSKLENIDTNRPAVMPPTGTTTLTLIVLIPTNFFRLFFSRLHPHRPLRRFRHRHLRRHYDLISLERVS